MTCRNIAEGMADQTSAKLTDDTDILEKGKMSIQQPQTTHMAELTSDSDIIGAARELCRAGGALVAAARDEGTAAELEAMFAALQGAAAGMYGQPKKERANLNALKPLYMLLGLIFILALIAVVLTASNNGVLTKGQKASTTKVQLFATTRPPAGNGNVCAGKKPKSGFDNVQCVEASVDEQAAADVSSPFTGTKETDYEPIMTSYWKAGMCPVNVHWHLGAEHRSSGQYDESGTGSQSRRAADPRQGLRCHHYNSKDAMFNSPYEFKHCKDMHVGETYEVHWPHSAGGACGTVNQYQTPFYDGVFCNGGDLAKTGSGFNIGVQAQVFTIVNDEAYYYPDLIKGMIIDGDKGDDMVFYTGSTTGDSRSNSICSKYTPITWQVDRKCHLVSASTFDKMCADMKAQRDDMTDDLHPHGAREVVAPEFTANNMKAGSLSGGRATFPS